MSSKTFWTTASLGVAGVGLLTVAVMALGSWLQKPEPVKVKKVHPEMWSYKRPLLLQERRPPLNAPKEVLADLQASYEHIITARRIDSSYCQGRFHYAYKFSARHKGEFRYGIYCLVRPPKGYYTNVNQTEGGSGWEPKSYGFIIPRIQ